MVAFRRFVVIVVLLSVILFFIQRSIAVTRLGNDSLRSVKHIDAFNPDVNKHFGNQQQQQKQEQPPQQPSFGIATVAVISTPPPIPPTTTSAPRTPSPQVRTEFQAAVVDAFLHSWKGYKKYAWGSDELAPVSRGGKNWDVHSGPKGLGLTIVESLDTMWLMGLRAEFEEATIWVRDVLNFDKDMTVSVFETTIRLLGGLCSAYDLSSNFMFVRKAVQLADRLLPAFNTPTGVPNNYINLRTGFSEPAHWNGGNAILSEYASIQLEFRRLAQITGNKSYDVAVTKAMKLLHDQCLNQFCPRYFNARTGEFGGGTAALGGFGDSYYEYLLKQDLQLNKKEPLYDKMWKAAAQTIHQHTIHTGKYTIPGSITGNSMEHLACFSGGLMALDYSVTKNTKNLQFAEDIAYTCHEMYQSSASKLSPDSVVISSSGISPGDSKYILRPETVETYFYLYRVTKNQKYRDWGFEVIKACNEVLRVESGGYSGTHNVNSRSGSLNDLMESFWMAETLKYLYLLASEDSVLDITKFVFNTEAHPLRVYE